MEQLEKRNAHMKRVATQTNYCCSYLALLQMFDFDLILILIWFTNKSCTRLIDSRHLSKYKGGLDWMIDQSVFCENKQAIVRYSIRFDSIHFIFPSDWVWKTKHHKTSTLPSTVETSMIPSYVIYFFLWKWWHPRLLIDV